MVAKPGLGVYLVAVLTTVALIASPMILSAAIVFGPRTGSSQSVWTLTMTLQVVTAAVQLVTFIAIFVYTYETRRLCL